MTNSIFSKQLQFLKHVVNLNLGEVSHEDSLTTAPNGGNSVNWLLGHMIVVRDGMMKALGLEPVANESLINLYQRGTDNVTAENANKLENLLEMYNRGSDEMIKRLEGDEVTDAEAVDTMTVLLFHEAYHAGQIGLFRRIMGKDSKIK
ncbi:MAG: DinB family protein [Bacteroidetes bacterium]|nr:DinB family protein [Bacteroidota bacterium]